METKETINVHYFARESGLGDPIMRDGSVIEPGMVHPHVDGPIQLCRSGYHGSVGLWDALSYAEGTYYCPRQLSGVMVVGDDKIAASDCVTLDVFWVNGLLHEFTCRFAEYYLDHFEVAWPAEHRQLIDLKRSWMGRFIPRYMLEIASKKAGVTAINALGIKDARRSVQYLFGDIYFYTTLGYEDEWGPECRAILTRLQDAADSILVNLFAERGIPNYVTGERE